MTEFRFTTEHSSAGIAGIVDALRQPRLWIPTGQDYPTHGAWLDKTEAQLAEGTKRAMAAYMGGKPIGTVIYQQSSETPGLLEVRNISISPDARGRHVGSFLLRNAEIEAARNDFPGVEQVVVDTKVSNKEMIAFLQSEGYGLEYVTDLYGQDTGLDAVLSKSLT